MKLKKIEQGMVIHCNTEEEAKELIKWAYECGFKWGTPYDNNYTFWSQPSNTDKLYFFDNHNWIYFNPISMDNIVEFSDLVIPEPKFKVGDIVKDNVSHELLIVKSCGYSEMLNTYFYNVIDFNKKDIVTTLFENQIIQENLTQTEASEEELTAKEAIQWLMDGCFDSRFYDMGGEDGDIYYVFDKFSAEDIANKIKKYKKDHTTLSHKEPEVEWVYECYNLDEEDNHHNITYEKEEDAMEYCRLWTIIKGSNLGYTYRKVCRVNEN